MMVSIARKNLFHDKTRLAMALGGIVFAVILMVFAVGIMYGTLVYAVYMVDHSDADIWVLSHKSQDPLSPALFDDNFATQISGTPGVQSASDLILSTYDANVKGGETKAVYLIGFDPATGLGQPWSMKEGQVQSLRRSMTTILDNSAADKFRPLEIGQKLEFAEQDVEVVGFCEGATWMLGMPFAYTSVRTAQRLLHWEGKTIALLVKTAPGADAEGIRRRIAAIPDLQAFSKQEMHDKYIEGWLAGTPAGYMSGAMVVIGFVVGLIMVGITLYTATIERIREFGALKAIGASNGDVYRIILEQAFILAAVGYVVGAVGGLVLGELYESAAGMLFDVPTVPLLAVFAIVVAMSGGSAFFATLRMAKIDPAMVFRS